jgi:hypothetical protein
LTNNGGVIRLSASDTINQTGNINVDAAPTPLVVLVFGRGMASIMVITVSVTFFAAFPSWLGASRGPTSRSFSL